ncbi:hypothetical protein [Deinococcus sp. 12RED42]|uniref:hypothetical protein n=1 Tax=Deinococcus sp. 12RED42 TaxID=2745872 RepID=UPI001E2AEA05|nr:hypothetical protein [Deinococcus sp. 12RED42]MCD0164176.1 hypothetical protein [Deinococcus sp. 12RED42]
MTFYLDAAGDAQREGTQSVRTEADFLRFALTSQPLLLHGERLCQWAEGFAAGRRIPVQKVYSPRAELQQLLPSLLPEEAKQVLQIWPEFAHDATLRSDLAVLVGHLVGGHAVGSAEHAAEWLMMRLEVEVEQQDLLSRLGEASTDLIPNPWKHVYHADHGALELLLLNWLGVETVDTGSGPWPVAFPLGLKASTQRLVRERMEQQLAAQGAEAFTGWQARGAIPEVLKLGATLVAHWLLTHSEALTPALVQRLSYFLPVQMGQNLSAALPVRLPAPLPEQVEAWGHWMQRDYLPYRTSATADQLALLPTLRAFAKQFLALYAKALNGGAHADKLVWQRCASLQGSRALTLVAVCDGLSLADLVTLQRHLTQQDITRRLSDLGSQVAFSALPTITKHAKPTLEHGIARVLSDTVAPLGVMPTQESKVRQALEQGKPGDIVFWNYVETDSLYHKAETLDQAKAKAGTTLLYLAQRLLGLMLDAIPVGVPAQLVITTDHGRLLLASRRSVTPPMGFTPEGRASFGKWEDIPAQGYEVGEDYAFLARSTFGMTKDVAVLWNNETFVNAVGATGLEICPHGGITPEEVLIPWVVYARDLEFRLPIVEVSGKGEAEKPGTLRVRVINPNPLPLTVTAWDGSLSLLLEGTAEWTLTPNDVTERDFHVGRWPRSADLPKLVLKLTVRAGQGAPQTVSAILTVETEELYTPTANILDDLL